MGYGRESPVAIRYKGLHSFRGGGGVILLYQGVLEAGGVSHLHGSALLTIPLRGFRKILCTYLTNDPLAWINVHVANLMFLSLFRGPWSFSWVQFVAGSAVLIRVGRQYFIWFLYWGAHFWPAVFSCCASWFWRGAGRWAIILWGSDSFLILSNFLRSWVLSRSATRIHNVYK